MANMEREQLGELLTGYLDNELDDRERAFVERLIESDVETRRWLESLRQTAASIRDLPRHEAPVSLAADLLEQLERRDLLADDPGVARSATIRFPWFGALSAAAVLVGVTLVGISQYPQWSSPNPTNERLALVDSPDRFDNTRGAERQDSSAAAPETIEEAPRHEALDVTAKLSSGVDIEAIRAHDFSNETVRLTVALKDRGRQKAALDRIVAHLTGMRVVDAASPEAARSQLASSAFFVNGKVGVNFQDRSKREVLVRIPGAALDDLLDEVAVEAVNAERVTFAAGSLTYDGLDNARRTLRPLGATEPEDKGTAMRRARVAARGPRLERRAADLKSREGDAAEEELAVELFKTLDIAPEVLTSNDGLGRQSGAGVGVDTTQTKTEVGEGDRIASADADHVRADKPAALADGEAGVSRELSPAVAATPPADKDRDAQTGSRPAYFVTLVLEFTVPPPDKPAGTPTGPKSPIGNDRNKPPKIQ